MRFSISPASESERNATPASDKNEKKKEREKKKPRKGERKRHVARRERVEEGPEKEVNEAEEAEGGRCWSRVR